LVGGGFIFVASEFVIMRKTQRNKERLLNGQIKKLGAKWIPKGTRV